MTQKSNFRSRRILAQDNAGLGHCLRAGAKAHLQQAQQETSTSVLVLEENTTRTFEHVNIALHGIATHLANQPSARHDLRPREPMLGHMKQMERTDKAGRANCSN